MPRTRVNQWAAGAVMMAALGAGCGSSDGASSTPAVYAAYVLLAPGNHGATTIALARAIVAPGEPACPTLEGTGAPISMSLRQNPHGFPVNVCEAAIPFGQSLRLSWNQQSLPAVGANPTHLLVLGDTGCDSADCPASDPAQPFAGIARGAGALEPPPDLILHVGDYNYRGTKGSVKVKNSDTKLPVYDAGDDAPDDPECQLTSAYVSQNADYSEQPDNWDDWWHDFFQPAQPLLDRAPWVFARGNHELCSRAGPGWFYFLDANTAATNGGTGQLECPFQGGDHPPDDAVADHLRFVPPYTLDLGTLRIAVIDSANACDGFAPETTTQIYAEQLRQVLDAVRPGVTTWIITHRPLWAATAPLTPPSGTPPDYDSIDKTLQEALARTIAGSGVLPDAVRLMVAGHIHAFQSASFFGDVGLRPPQLVIGNSGVALDTHAPTGAFDATVDGLAAHVLGLAEFGFLNVAQLHADGSWRGALVGANATVLADCDTARLPDSLCVPPD
jgi:Calcineurin-like phosphoesterase